MDLPLRGGGPIGIQARQVLERNYRCETSRLP